MPNFVVPDFTTDEWEQRFIRIHNRAVFWLDPEKVIKFGCPYLEMSGGQNRTESFLWKDMIGTSRDKLWFAGVLANHYNGEWLVMERADGDALVTRQDKPKLLALAKKYDFPPEEIKASNLGFHHKTRHIVIRDYGLDYFNDMKDTVERCGECTFCRLYDTIPSILAQRKASDVCPKYHSSSAKSDDQNAVQELESSGS